MKFLLVWFFRPLSTPGGYHWSPKLTRSNFFFFHFSKSKNFFFKLFLIKKKWGLLVDKSKLYGYRGQWERSKKKKKKKNYFWFRRFATQCTKNFCRLGFLIFFNGGGTRQIFLKIFFFFIFFFFGVDKEKNHYK